MIQWKSFKYYFRKKGNEDFLKWFEFLLEYSKEVLNVNDLDIAADKLKKMTKINKAVGRIFNKLVERNPSKYYEIKNVYS